MKIQTIKSAFASLALLLTACSTSQSENEYVPTVASYLGNKVWMSFETDKGNVYNHDSLIAQNKLRAYGELSQRNLNLRSVRTDKGQQLLELVADLPNMQAMTFNEDGTGTGTSKATIFIENQQVELTFHFKLSGTKGTATTYGSSALSVMNVEQGGVLFNYTNTDVITLKKDSNGKFLIK